MGNHKTIERNGTEFVFGADGFTVHLQERPSDYIMAMRGIVAESPQDAIGLAKLWFGFNEVAIAKVYPGEDGWYAADECIYEEIA